MRDLERDFEQQGADDGDQGLAVVRRDHYGDLHRLLPELPNCFGTWIERRFAERRSFEEASGRTAKIEIVDPAGFEQFCIQSNCPPTLEALDEWAPVTAWVS